MKNCRSISVIPVVAKVFERIIYDQQYVYRFENTMIAAQRSGFSFCKLLSHFKHCDCSGQLEAFLLVWLSSIWPPLKFNVLLWVKNSEWSI